jgi:hypothetical protein
MTTTFTAKEVASKFETDARTLRKFIRSPQGLDMTVGKGQRWSIEARELRSLKTRFNAWNAAKNASKASDAPDEDPEVIDDPETAGDAVDGDEVTED